MSMKELDNIKQFEKWLKSHRPKSVAIQSLDLRPYETQLQKLSLKNCIFFACEMSNETAGHIVQSGGIVVANHEDYHFVAHRAKLYSPIELFDGFDPSISNGYTLTKDYQIYEQYLQQGKDMPDTILTSLMRRLHDHSITEALNDAIKGRKVVAIMGGHGMERQDPFYTKIATLSRRLTQKGFLMVSGGGPGAMEATHLGAYFSARKESELHEAIQHLKIRPADGKPGKEYADHDWLHRAWNVMQQYPLKGKDKKAAMSIGIPTWLYGHEPPTLFATHIAKYFANSVREDGLVSIAKHGIIFAPGSAGTTQEIFQDVTQNHYGSMGVISPMILFGKKAWTEDRPIWDFLQKTSEGKIYKELLSLTDNEDEIIRRILSYNPEIYKV